MRNIAAVFVVTIVVYLVCWSLAYLCLVGVNFNHYVEYLRLAWTNPGEIPAFLQIASLLTTAVLMLLVF